MGDKTRRKELKAEKKAKKKDKKKDKKKRKSLDDDQHEAKRSKSDDDATRIKSQEDADNEKEAAIAKSQDSQDNATAEDPNNNITILLFYQYVEPPWSEQTYKYARTHVEDLGKKCQITGRMRVAREGLNCTLTGTKEGVLAFCRALRAWKPCCFDQTEFKLTHNLPLHNKFADLKIIPVAELVNYGIPTTKAPPIKQYQGVHLEPKEYHEKIAEKDTVIIDVRNHYEAIIGRFVPPTESENNNSNKNNDSSDDNAPKWLDPKMRKSTEFPKWLDSPETLESIKGKQVLMYCTGGIRCERASSLLKYKMETDERVKSLGIKGVYQLQGGIDKYFKEFPDGGYWKGKNYVFDKRFTHAPDETAATAEEVAKSAMAKCESCHEPWDQYRGKRRCPTCGVPSLICRDCYLADKSGKLKIDASVRCDLCVEQGIKSKKQIKSMEAEIETGTYWKDPNEILAKTDTSEQNHNDANPDGITRLFIKNMCNKSMTEEVLLDFIPGITHIMWKVDRKTNKFFGQGWVEMQTPNDAAEAVAKSGKMVLGRPIYIMYQPADGKDLWPPPNCTVAKKR